jgi:hypothetical protein
MSSQAIEQFDVVRKENDLLSISLQNFRYKRKNSVDFVAPTPGVPTLKCSA